MQAAAAFSLPLPLPMPIAAPKPCVVCRVLVTDGSARCPAHKRAPWVKHADAPKRITGRRLQRMRREFFESNPLCAICAAEGRVSMAVQLDHIRPLFAGGRDGPGNLQGLCVACHKRKTRADLGYKTRIGFDAAGMPSGWGGSEKSSSPRPETARYSLLARPRNG